MITRGSLILETAARFIFPLLLLFSIFLLLRGHDEPGGGFIGGLVAALAYALYAFAYDAEKARRVLRVDPRGMLGWGLLIATASGLPALFRGQGFLTAQWWDLTLPLVGEFKLSTPLIFDIGVYLVVIGTVMAIVLTLAEAED